VIDLFFPIVAEHKLHVQFRDLRNSPHHGCARNLINDVFARMGDPNGSFARHFQGEAFHSRLFEIACFAYLESAELTIDRSFPFPDFIATKEDYSVAIEVVTANPPAGTDRDISVARLPDLSEVEINQKANVEFPRRMEAILRKKLGRRYHDEPHVSGKPLVLMIAPFFEPGASFYIDESLLSSLYGPPAENLARDVGYERGFFRRDDASAVSAVLYCNSFSVSKFLRLADPLLFERELLAVRSGSCYVPHNDTENALRHFEFRVDDPTTPRETWAEGVTVFLNPMARHPLRAGVLPVSSVISVQEGYVTREVDKFHPVASSMMVTLRDQPDVVQK
jgi:hypothetical protein